MIIGGFQPPSLPSSLLCSYLVMYIRPIKLLFIFSLFIGVEAFSGMQIPDNAHIDHFSYQGWSCNRGYRQVGYRCDKVLVPQNAELDYYGNDWVCKRGYVKRASSCIYAKYASNSEVRQLIIDESVSNYPGNCPCSYFTDSAGRRCGRRSAYNRAGGFSPLCFPNDVSDVRVAGYRKQFQ